MIKILAVMVFDSVNWKWIPALVSSNEKDIVEKHRELFKTYSLDHLAVVEWNANALNLLPPSHRASL